MVISPSVCVIIPTYNRRRWIGECLDALARQTYQNFEAIVVDDRSTDGTVEWLRSNPKYSFVRIHVQEKNSGASIARNTGIWLARSELIAFIDSDDLLEPKHLETAVAAFQQYPNLGLFCCDAVMIGPEGEMLNDGRTWQTVNGEIKSYLVKSGLRCLTDIFLFSNSFPGFTLRREVFDKAGYLNQDIFPLDDYDLALRVAGCGYQVYYCHQPLARYRVHGNNSSGTANGTKVGREKLRCLRLALTRNPEIQQLGAEVSRRMADVMLELAVSYAYAGDRIKAAQTLSRAVVNDPSQVVKLARLSERWMRRRVRRG